MLHSSHLSDGRELTIFLPPGYEEQIERRYQVLYLHDGQNLFDATTAFGGIHWRAGETATALITAGRIEPLIIAGIANTGAKRINEYTPTHDRRRGGGAAEAYGRLIIHEVKPFVDARFRTLRHREHTTIGGSSLGGLVSLYLALTLPLVFGTVVAMSPSVWWDRRAILRDVRGAAALIDKPRIWLDMGTAESRGAGSAKHVLEDVRLLRAGLLKAGWIEGGNLHYEEVDGGTHSELAWGDRFSRILQWLSSVRGGSGIR